MLGRSIQGAVATHASADRRLRPRSGVECWGPIALWESESERHSGREPSSDAPTFEAWHLAGAASGHRRRSDATHGIYESATSMLITVRDNNVDQALRALKKKLQREGVYREMKLRRHYEKPSEKRARQHAAAVSRARKADRKRAERDS
jgi:small subunit ribosomal protein S21